MTYQAIQVMDQSSTSQESEEQEESIDSLLARAEAGDPNLTEADYERIDAANFGPGWSGAVPR